MNAIEQNARKQRWPIVWGENRIDHRHGPPPILPGTKTARFLHHFLHLFENASLPVREPISSDRKKVLKVFKSYPMDV